MQSQKKNSSKEWIYLIIHLIEQNIVKHKIFSLVSENLRFQISRPTINKPKNTVYLKTSEVQMLQYH